MTGLLARGAEPDIAAWNEQCRLDPARGAAHHLDEPQVQAAFTTIATNMGPAMSNLQQLAT
jgi:hypothetical protein